MPAAVALALAAAFCFGSGLILSQIGLRGIAPIDARRPDSWGADAAGADLRPSPFVGLIVAGVAFLIAG